MLVRAGHVFPDSVGEFWAQEGEGFTLYAIARRTVLILERLYFLDLPLMAGMKSSEKFSFLERCEVVTLSFNSFAYRRGEEVDAVYYLLEGQVKMFKELGENVYEVASLERGRLFGLFEVKNRIRHRELYARAGLNATAVMKIPIKLVEKVCLDRETTLDAMLADAKSEIYSMLPKNALSERRPSIPQRVESGTVSGNGSGSSGNGDSSRVML
jgi:CRP-like cAMP-binding protein